MEITKRVEFDAGHRVPSHRSKCCNMHGHRYVMEVTLKGQIKPVRGESDDGMVLDFADVKTIAQALVERWDHAFIVFDKDTQCRAALSAMGTEHKTVIVPFIPTVENLADAAFVELAKMYREKFGDALFLTKVRLFETPNSWADSKGGREDVTQD